MAKDLDNENKDQVSEETKESKKGSGITPEATFDSPNGKDVHRPIVYLELVLAIVALIAIIAAILHYRKQQNPGTAEGTVQGTVVSGDLAGDLTGSLSGDTTIDNSDVAALKPAIPDVTAMNTLTEEACQAKVAEGTMIRLDCSDGSYVYVNNYRDQDYLSAQIASTDDYIDQFIKENFLDAEPVLIEVDHDTAELGDYANIDYCGKKDGVAFDGGTAEGYDLGLGTNTFIPGFEDGVVGMKIGETKDIPLTFPENYGSEELAGKDVIFTVTLNKLSQEGYATELTDEYANYYTDGMCPTAQEMKDYLRDNYLGIEKMENFLMENLYISGVSQDAINESYEMQVKQIVDYAAMYGMGLGSFLSMQGYDLQQVLNDIMAESADQARADALYRGVLENDLQPITDSDISKLALDEGYEGTVEQFIAENGRDELTLYLMRDKATAYLQELADKAALSSAPADTNEVVSEDEVTEVTDVDNAENTNAEEVVEPAEAAQ